MSKAAVIINPRSGRGRGKGLALASALSSTADAQVTVLENFDALYPALAEAAGAGVTDIFISSGDGTVHAIQTWLAESGAFRALPRLCLLPHGTTNMTAADLGFRRKAIADQAHFIADPVARERRTRPTLRIANPRSGAPIHGMFLGTGAVSEATRYCQRVFNDGGLGGNHLAPLATLAGALGKSVFFKPNPADPNRFDRPYALHVTADGAALAEGEQLLVMATTLDKLILGARPFWGGADAPLRLTTLPYPVPNPLRWLVPTLYGRETRKTPPGAVSRAVRSFAVTSPVSYVLDGEFFDGPENEPLRVETGPVFDYITA